MAEHRAGVGSRRARQEAVEGGAHLVALAAARPRRAEGQLVPDLVDVRHQLLDVAGPGGELALGDPVGEGVHERCRSPGAWLDVGCAAGLALEEPLRRALGQAGQRARREPTGSSGGAHRPLGAAERPGAPPASPGRRPAPGRGRRCVLGASRASRRAAASRSGSGDVAGRPAVRRSSATSPASDSGRARAALVVRGRVERRARRGTARAARRRRRASATAVTTSRSRARVQAT